jgi:putative transposase
MAIWRRGKPDTLLHHSDRGSQVVEKPSRFEALMARDKCYYCHQ